MVRTVRLRLDAIKTNQRCQLAAVYLVPFAQRRSRSPALDSQTSSRQFLGLTLHSIVLTTARK
jgi:hypothetical protein